MRRIISITLVVMILAGLAAISLSFVNARYSQIAPLAPVWIPEPRERLNSEPNPWAYDSEIENLECDLMPLVGKEVKVKGTFRGGIAYSGVVFPGGSIYIHADKQGDLSREIELISTFDGHTVEATGPLHYFPQDPQGGQGLFAHFYFAAGEVNVISLKSPPPGRTSRPNR